MKRFKTKYPGVYYIIGKSSINGQPERIYYVNYRKSGQRIEEKAGRQATMKSIGDIFADNGLYCIQGNNDRVNGWANMKEYMYRDANLKPKFYVFENCVNIINTLPGLVHSDTIPEDLEKRGAEDHLADAMRYLLMHTYQSNPPEPEKCPQTIFEEEIVGEEEIVDWLDGV